MTYDTPIVGENFFTNGGHIRDNDNTIVTYPCGGAIHYCGQALGGAWWHMRENLGATYGSATGLAIAQQNFVDWSLITTGGSGNNAAHPGTAIEVLTVDDDDGNLDNGTPNYDDICAAFGMHNISCPEVEPIIFAYPDGLPESLIPGQATDIAVTLTSNGVDPVPNTAMIWYLVDGGGLIGNDLVYHGGNSYTATIDPVECLSVVDYFFQVQGNDGNTYSDPRTGTYVVSAYDALDIIVSDDFETNNGWTVENIDLADGQWTRGVPVGGGTRGDPANDFDGSGKCWLTDNVAGNSDVDGGPTRLISPAFDLSAAPDAVVSYARWFTNDDNDGDRLRVEVSSNNGGSWVLVESVANTIGWVVVDFRVADFVTPTSQVRVRFSATDNPNDSITEAGIDAFSIVTVLCNDCIADFNNDGSVNTQDVLAFLNAWNAGDSSADINGDGEINTQDVLAFLNLWNAGC